MLSCTTMVMAGGRGQRLNPLSRNRAKPAIRFGGLYRIIDFTLSNCINSDIRRIFILTQYASTSLERHIRHGWGHIFHTGMGEFIETRPPQQFGGKEWYEGTADSVYKSLDVVAEENNEYTLILSGDHVYKMDYRKIINFHREHGAELTIASIETSREQASQLGVLTVDKNMRIRSFDEKPESPATIPGKKDKCLCNMGVYCYSTEFLVRSLSDHFQRIGSRYDFGKDIIPELVRSKHKVFAYPFEDENRKTEPYWRDIGTLDAYFEASMDLVNVDPVFNLYDKQWPVRSFIQQLPPVKTVFNWGDRGRVGMALESLVSPGVIISGGRVERSVLSPEVKVHSYAQVSDSILFDRVEVGEGAIVRNAIVDHGVKIPPGARIGLDPEKDAKFFTVTEKGICIVTE